MRFALIRFALLALCSFLTLSGVQAQHGEVPGEPAAGLKPLLNKVQVLFEVHNDMFPETWYSRRISARAESLSPAEYERSMLIVNRALKKYPDSVITGNLESVYVLHSLQFFGASYGGTYHNKTVYLSNKGERFHYSDAYIERVFHAEFSSVLLAAYPKYLDQEAWQACNHETVVYGSGGMQALKDGKSSEVFAKEWNELGFLNQYSQSSVENDFNAMAKNLFLPLPGFWEVTDKYEGLLKKREQAINFYQQINPQFTEEYFRSLAE